MGAADRNRRRGSRRGRRILQEFAAEVIERRLSAEISQEELGRRLGMSGDKIGRIEHAKLESLSILDAAEIGAVLGLDVSFRVYPTGVRLRDAGQARRLAAFLGHVGKPLSLRTDVPLLQHPDRPFETRAWDAVLYGSGARTAIEFESRITDAQQMTRRHGLKRRDDAVDRFVLVAADTRHNRGVLREYAALFADLPRLRTANVLKMLRDGHHPPTGYMLLGRAPLP